MKLSREEFEALTEEIEKNDIREEKKKHIIPHILDFGQVAVCMELSKN